MQLNDMLGLGKILPVDKLLELISKATGRLTKSYFDKKDIETKAQEIRTLGAANTEVKIAEMKAVAEVVKSIHQGTGGIEYNAGEVQISSPKELPQQVSIPTLTLEERTKERILYQEAKRQLNIENITAIATEQLKSEPAVEDTPLDEDWTNRFFKMAEDVSNEEMQMLWGKILAGEVKRPKSYSLRTLELIKNLSKDEADVISKVFNFVFYQKNDYLIYNSHNKMLEKLGVSFYDLGLMKELGLIYSSDLARQKIPSRTEAWQNTFIFGKHANCNRKAS